MGDAIDDGKSNIGIHTVVLPENSNIKQMLVAIYQLKNSTISCAESPRSGPYLSGWPSTFSYLVKYSMHNLSRKLGIWLGCRQPTVCRVFGCHPSNYNIYIGTETESTRVTRNSKSSKMDLTVILLPPTSRRLRIVSLSSRTVPTICVSSIPPRT